MVRKLIGSLLLACLAAYAVISFTTNHSYVTTPSMYPTIPPGSEIFISSAKDYRVGEVIVFHANGLTWAHRLIQIKPDGSYVTKGDNPANAPDLFIPAVTKSDVVGVVTYAPKWLGFPELIAHQPGYGLSWLRAELDLRAKLVLTGIIGLLAFASASGGKTPRIGRHRQPKSSRRRPTRSLFRTRPGNPGRRWSSC
ncbi:MAG TPA: signal peptidase I [Blastococcus sp.]|nr:signal peptidase I [Blastococcus sp.]